MPRSLRTIAWWVREHIEGKVPVLTNTTIVHAKPTDAGRLLLTLRDDKSSDRLLICDHVIAGTGYVVDIDKLSFMNAELRSSIRRIERGPLLDRPFQSSVPRLYFIVSL